MFDLRGGFSPADFDAADRRLAQAGDASAIVGLIRNQAIYLAPHYHAHLRQLRLHYERSAESNPHGVAAFLATYDLFFMLLQWSAHADPDAPDGEAAPAAEPFAPACLSALLDIASAVAPQGWADASTFVLPGQLDALLRDAERRTAAPCPLPPYVEVPGARFAVMIVACTRCSRPRAALRCYALDARQTPWMLDHLVAGRINQDRCPECAATKCDLVACWVVEEPFPADPLALQSCLCRVSNHEAIYLPPAGMVRQPENDRIHEIRGEALMRQLGRPWDHGDEFPAIHTDGVAYGALDVARRLAQNARRGPFVVEYSDCVQGLHEKLSSGELPYGDARTLIAKIDAGLLRQWPLFEESRGDPILVLVERLLFDATVEAQAGSAGSRFAARCRVAEAFIGIHQIGLAEASLAEAEDLVPELPCDEAADARIACLSLKESLHTARGDFALAAAVRETLSEATQAFGDTPAERLARAALMINDGLALQSAGRLSEAYALTNRCLRESTEASEALSATDVHSARFATINRSGCIANLSGMLGMAADMHDVIDAMKRRDVEPASLPPHVVQLIRQFDSAEALMAFQHDVLERLPTLIGADATWCDSADGLRQEAVRGYLKAISLAEEADDPEYLGVQWYQLGLLFGKLGQADASREALDHAVREAVRANDDERIAAVSFRQANDAQAAGTVAALFDALERCLRAHLRARIAGSNRLGGSMEAIGSLALDAATNDVDRLRAVLIVEAAKKLELARSVSLGPPSGSEAPASSASSARAARLDGLLKARETRLIGAQWDTPDDAVREGGAGDAELDAEIAAARADLAVRDPAYAAWHNATFVDLPNVGWLRGVLRKLGPDTTLLGLHVSGREGYAYALWDGGCLTTTAVRPDALAVQDDAASVEELADWTSTLVSGLHGRLSTMEDHHHLIVSPCDALRAVPFAALLIGGRLLVERATLSIMLGLGMLSVCIERPVATFGRVLCIGGPARPDESPLERSLDEVRAVADLLREADVQVIGLLKGAKATVANVTRLLGDSDLVHFACHAEPPDRSDDPHGRRARLLLAPDFVAQDSGDLTDQRIVTLPVRPGALIVMASCSSGVEGKGERLLDRGLVPAWLVAGANHVLATLWPIADDAAQSMLTAFYRHLVTGAGPSAALALAQRDAVRGVLGEALREPRHWASYFMHGLR